MYITAPPVHCDALTWRPGWAAVADASVVILTGCEVHRSAWLGHKLFPRLVRGLPYSIATDIRSSHMVKTSESKSDMEAKKCSVLTCLWYLYMQ